MVVEFVKEEARGTGSEDKAVKNLDKISLETLLQNLIMINYASSIMFRNFLNCINDVIF